MGKQIGSRREISSSLITANLLYLRGTLTASQRQRRLMSVNSCHITVETFHNLLLQLSAAMRRRVRPWVTMRATSLQEEMDVKRPIFARKYLGNYSRVSSERAIVSTMIVVRVRTKAILGCSLTRFWWLHVDHEEARSISKEEYSMRGSTAR